MKIKLIYVSLMLTLFVSNVNSKDSRVQQNNSSSLPQTITLYTPQDKTTGKYDESRACFSFKFGTNKRPNSTDWDLGYGFIRIGDEDWLRVSTIGDSRSVIKDLGKFGWSDSFRVPVLEPLPELKAGENRRITIDSSADTHKAWKESTDIFAKAEVEHMYVVHVKDKERDFYVLFRVEELGQEEYCKISWKRVATPEK